MPTNDRRRRSATSGRKRPASPTSEHDRRERGDRLGAEQRPLRVEPREESNGPSPQWCCHQSVGEPERQRDEPERRRAAPSRRSPRCRSGPSPIAAHRSRQHAGEHDERGQRRDACSTSQSTSLAARVARARDRASAARSSGAGRGRRGASDGTLVRQRSHAQHAPRQRPRRLASAAFPMRVAVISDIHANLHALEAVLADIDAEAPDEVWCLGDVVGYGPRAERVLSTLVRERAAVCLVGNHDLAVDRRRSTSPSSAATRPRPRAGRSGVLGDRKRAPGCATLEPRGDAAGRRALPRQPARSGLGVRPQRGGRARSRCSATTAPLVLVGHSHVALALAWDGERLDGRPRPGRHRGRPRRRPLAAQPGLGRPAARRRPAGRVAVD